MAVEVIVRRSPTSVVSATTPNVPVYTVLPYKIYFRLLLFSSLMTPRMIICFPCKLFHASDVLYPTPAVHIIPYAYEGRTRGGESCVQMQDQPTVACIFLCNGGPCRKLSVNPRICCSEKSHLGNRQYARNTVTGYYVESGN